LQAAIVARMNNTTQAAFNGALVEQFIRRPFQFLILGRPNNALRGLPNPRFHSDLTIRAEQNWTY
jgi:hypothetical protein